MRFIRIASMGGDTPQAVDLGVRSPGKIIINNAGSTDLYMGQDRSDVLLAGTGQFLTISAGVMIVFDVSEMVGYIGQRQMLWFNSPIGTGTLEVAIFSEA